MSQLYPSSTPFTYLWLFFKDFPDAPRFTIVAFNDTRAEQTFTRKQHIGKGIFEAFPDNPGDPQANGVSMLTASLQTVIREKKPHQMAVQKYDIPTADRQDFEESRMQKKQRDSLWNRLIWEHTCSTWLPMK